MARRLLRNTAATAARDGRSRGQSLVEFALVVPVFLMIAFGTIDFGLAFDASMVITNAAREGAREGVTNPSTTAVTARVREVAGRLNNSNLTVSVSCRTTSGAACSGGVSGATTGNTLLVTVNYNYPMITPIAFGTIIPLSSTAQMRVE
jgi:Flp pilus assembly protein TadG